MKKKILIVDDTDYTLKLMRTVLEELGYEVATTQEGSEVLSICKEFKPDLILLDIVMPEVSGFEVCRDVKKDEEAGAKVIIYTGNADAVNSREVRESGADGFAVKTEALDEIIRKIEEVL